MTTNCKCDRCIDKTPLERQISSLLWEWNLKNSEKVKPEFLKTLKEVERYFAHTAIYTERATEVEN